MHNVTKVCVEETDNTFNVNGIDVPKDFLLRLFSFLPEGPSDPQGIGFDTLTAYLCLVPLIQDRTNHFRKHHQLSSVAIKALDLARPIYKALDLHEDGSERAFLLACMARLEISYEHISIVGEAIFGACADDEDDTTDDQKGITVH